MLITFSKSQPPFIPPLPQTYGGQRGDLNVVSIVQNGIKYSFPLTPLSKGEIKTIEFQIQLLCHHQNQDKLGCLSYFRAI